MKKIIMFLVPIFIYFIINLYLSNINFDYEKKYSIYYSSAINESKSNNPLDFLNVGSSHSDLAFIYPENLTTVNFGMGAQDLNYSLKLIESVNHRVNEQTVIIIQMSYFSFGYFYDNNPSRYVDFLSFNKIENLTYENYLLTKYFPLIGIENVINLYNSIKNGFVYHYNSLHKSTDDRIWNLESDKTVDRHIEMFNSGFDEFNMNLILNFIENNPTIMIILVNTPYHSSYNSRMIEYTYILNYYYEKIEILTKFPNVFFLDYSRDDRFENKIEYFLDDDHLNYIGATLFTDILLNDINSLNID